MTSDLWVKEVEPQNLNQMIGQEELVEMFKEYAKIGHIPNMTIDGAPGCGKTLLMKCFAIELGFVKYVDGEIVDLIPGQFYIMDASSDRGIDVVRKTMKRLAQKPTINGVPRLVVLDEFNYTADAQAAMRSLMQECSDNTRFILLSNDTSNIIEPIISRCPIKTAKPLTLENMKTLVERIQKSKQFKITPEAIEYLYKTTQGDIRAFIGKLQEACIISNFDVQLKHVQNIDIDIQTAKSILEVAQTNYEQAKEVMMTVYMKTRNSKDLLEKLYMATYLVRFSEVIPDNEIIARRLRERIAEADFRLSPSQGTNPLVQLDAIINYIRLIKFVPLQCPRAK
jgi:putative ATPase